MVPVIASTKTDNRMMGCAGVDSGAKMLVVRDVSPLSAPERVSGTRTNVAIKNTHLEMSVLFGAALSAGPLPRFGSTAGFMRLPSYSLQSQPKKRTPIENTSRAVVIDTSFLSGRWHL